MNEKQRKRKVRGSVCCLSKRGEKVYLPAQINYHGRPTLWNGCIRERERERERELLGKGEKEGEKTREALVDGRFLLSFLFSLIFVSSPPHFRALSSFSFRFFPLLKCAFSHLLLLFISISSPHPLTLVHVIYKCRLTFWVVYAVLITGPVASFILSFFPFYYEAKLAVLCFSFKYYSWTFFSRSFSPLLPLLPLTTPCRHRHLGSGSP